MNELDDATRRHTLGALVAGVAAHRGDEAALETLGTHTIALLALGWEQVMDALDALADAARRGAADVDRGRHVQCRINLPADTPPDVAAEYVEAAHIVNALMVGDETAAHDRIGAAVAIDETAARRIAATALYELARVHYVNLDRIGRDRR